MNDTAKAILSTELEVTDRAISSLENNISDAKQDIARLERRLEKNRERAKALREALEDSD